MKRRYATRAAALILTCLALLCAVGCETQDRRDALTHAEALAAGADAGADTLFHPDVTLYRRYTGSKWKLDKDHVFTVKDESHVKARVEFNNMRPERTYSVHLAWIKPDGREIKQIRRYAEITRHLVSLPEGVLPDSTGALPGFFVDQLVDRFGEKRGADVAERLSADPDATVTVNEKVYKKAVDLGYANRRLSVGSDPSFVMETWLNISREKERLLGDYILRIYLDRRLLHETPFTVRENT